MQKDFFKSPEQVREWNEAQVPLWFWNDRLKRDELVRQMSIMSEKGITCSAPHARSGFEGGYLDDAWMEHIKTVIEYKTRHSETMWLYDEFNWPAGIANGQVTRHEAFREKYLSIQMFHVGSGVRFRRQPEDICRTGKTAPDDPVRDREGRRSINNLFCYDAKTMEPLDIRQFQPDDKSGCLFNLSENDFEICRDRDTIVFEARIQTELYQGEGMLTPDYLNKEATEYFLETTYEAYYKRFPDAFGSVITASFNDETRFCHAFPWTDRLLELFEERFGYRLEERIWYCRAARRAGRAVIIFSSSAICTENITTGRSANGVKPITLITVPICWERRLWQGRFGSAGISCVSSGSLEDRAWIILERGSAA